MAISPDLRASVRAAFRGQCGDCGVSETSVGGELEIDHFHPQAAGGESKLENLDVSAHITETAQGHLMGVTARGWFHIHRVHLNRPLLIEMRRLRRVAEGHREVLLLAQAAEARLRVENDSLRGEISRLRAAIAEMLRRGER